ncbi:MAG: hypothetical protein ACR2GV_05825 [Gaiellaceae bacterium]
MSSSDSKYNRSEKGKARYARYRAAHREKIRESQREQKRERWWANDNHYRLARCQYMTLYHARRQLENARGRAESLYG